MSFLFHNSWSQPRFFNRPAAEEVAFLQLQRFQPEGALKKSSRSQPWFLNRMSWEIGHLFTFQDYALPRLFKIPHFLFLVIYSLFIACYLLISRCSSCLHRNLTLGLFFVTLLIEMDAFAQKQDTLRFSGLVSCWGNYNPGNALTLNGGARYIPQINFGFNKPANAILDLEASVHISINGGIHPFDSISSDGKIKPYRLWVRLSGKQYEFRLGLQKINFGSASMLRPLMWFDQLDPRDPLHLTDGVWGLLGRYYFLNNANLWLWSLMGNKGPKTWEAGKTCQEFPEMGGRIQIPAGRGETAVTYHFRKSDTRALFPGLTGMPDVPEHRFGIDGKWDIGPGIWFEGSWIHKTKNTGPLTNQEMMSIGMDYTVGIGNGLSLLFEHLWYAMDEKAFHFDNSISFSGLSFSYPLGLNHQISAIFYHDWKNNSQYNFLNWRRQFNHFYLYLMAFRNPENYSLPQQAEGNQLFSGTGIQAMVVFNY
jgi:hypothetical protein